MTFPIFILLLGAVGHVILWVAVVNRLHGLGAKRHWIDAGTYFSGGVLALVPPAIALVVYRDWTGQTVSGVARAATWSYLFGCALVTVFAAIDRLRLVFHPERRGILMQNDTVHFDVRERVREPLTAPGIPTLLSRLPGNQVLNLTLHEEHLAIPRLPRALDGLRIAHISDLHMSGRITQAYFREVAELVNQCQPDLVAVTGDLVERDHCIDWIPDTLGRLRAPAGVHYIRGNHDRRVRDQQRLLTALAEAGLNHIGNCWQTVAVREASIVLAGNELPWYAPAADMADCPLPDADGLPLRILLAHSPDQFRWAQQHGFDLMLAGHNHGGQVRLPLFGAVLTPSLVGTRYASGVFRAGQTVLHVSRGTSSLTPIRYNCPPEIALLVLRAGEQ